MSRVAAQILRSEFFQPRPPLAQRKIDERMTLVVREQVECDEQARRLFGELAHAARGRMNALEQRVEREGVAFRNHDLAVEHELLRLQLADRLGYFREIARQRLAGFRLQLDRVAVAKREAAKSVPFRLVLPLRPARDFADGHRLHGREAADAARVPWDGAAARCRRYSSGGTVRR